jgi:hypothetical protein
MIVVMHRPPLKRVDFSLRPRVIEPETASEGTIALRELGLRIQNERIWDLLTRSAQGCNPAGGEA